MEIREQLISELHHRIKNNMQLVLSLINLESIEESGFNIIKDRIKKEDMEIIEFQLAAIFGSIETDWELKTVYITFRDEL